ncbi:hypothetical protein, partial [Klebsiella pneumoniae]|uniref:hypothetical protein n=1 Tax=Klebsiella pneumoniae TaxID=573 RepID=UPI003AF3C970
MCNGVIFTQYFSPRLLNQISESHHLTTLTPDIVIKGTVAKLAMRQPFVLFKGLTFQKLCLP